MTVEQMRAALQTRPFRPFIIHLADGRQVPVRNQEFAIMSPTGRTIIVYQPDDSCNVIDLLLVTDLESKAETAVQGNA
jgi:hypothetical protein